MPEQTVEKKKMFKQSIAKMKLLLKELKKNFNDDLSEERKRDLFIEYTILRQIFYNEKDISIEKEDETDLAVNTINLAFQQIKMIRPKAPSELTKEDVTNMYEKIIKPIYSVIPYGVQIIPGVDIKVRSLTRTQSQALERYLAKSDEAIYNSKERLENDFAALGSCELGKDINSFVEVAKLFFQSITTDIKRMYTQFEEYILLTEKNEEISNQLREIDIQRKTFREGLDSMKRRLERVGVTKSIKEEQKKDFDDIRARLSKEKEDNMSKELINYDIAPGTGISSILYAIAYFFVTVILRRSKLRKATYVNDYGPDKTKLELDTKFENIEKEIQDLQDDLIATQKEVAKAEENYALISDQFLGKKKELDINAEAIRKNISDLKELQKSMETAGEHIPRALNEIQILVTYYTELLHKSGNRNPEVIRELIPIIPADISTTYKFKHGPIPSSSYPINKEILEHMFQKTTEIEGYLDSLGKWGQKMKLLVPVIIGQSTPKLGTRSSLGSINRRTFRMPGYKNSRRKEESPETLRSSVQSLVEKNAVPSLDGLSSGGQNRMLERSVSVINMRALDLPDENIQLSPDTMSRLDLQPTQIMSARGISKSATMLGSSIMNTVRDSTLSSSQHNSEGFIPHHRRGMSTGGARGQASPVIQQCSESTRCASLPRNGSALLASRPRMVPRSDSDSAAISEYSKQIERRKPLAPISVNNGDKSQSTLENKQSRSYLGT